ncbi:MAG: HEPN domain-containing protein [Deltaproteobacteria bacterium]|nr:HEPN domain-containing protein [Deltaproteobacteria bacterium]
MKKAEGYLQAAELLQRHGLYTQSVTASYYSTFHASIAAFLTSGINHAAGEPFASFTATLERFSGKLDPFIETLKEHRKEWGLNAGLEYPEKEALLRLHLTREFFLEVKDFLRRVVK